MPSIQMEMSCASATYDELIEEDLIEIEDLPVAQRATAQVLELEGISKGDQIRLIAFYDDEVDILTEEAGTSDLYRGAEGIVQEITLGIRFPYLVRFSIRAGHEVTTSFRRKEIELATFSIGDSDWEV